MSEQIQAAINVLLVQIEEKNREVNEIKRTINGLCRAAKIEPMFGEIKDSVTGFMSINTDQFYGIGPTAAVRNYLEMRTKSRGAATLDEILEALQRGGFDFEGQGWSDSSRWKNQVSIAIGKNTTIFHRLPNDTIGLLTWYPDAQPKKKRNSGKDDDKSGIRDADNGETDEAKLPKESALADTEASNKVTESPDSSSETNGDEDLSVAAATGPA